MYAIDYEDLLIGDRIAPGYYGNIYKVLYGATEYAFKIYKKPSLVLNEELEFKLCDLSLLELNHSLIPWALVKENGKTKGYISNLADYRCFSFLECLSTESKIRELKKAKTYIEELINNNIIHADIHKGNILLRDELIIDFDNSFYKTHEPNFDLLSFTTKEFILKYGPTKDLDIYSYNLMTYGLLNNIKMFNIQKNIENKNYGVFTDTKSIKICDSLLLNDEKFNNEFLIDYIDNDSIEKSNSLIKKMYK